MGIAPLVNDGRRVAAAWPKFKLTRVPAKLLAFLALLRRAGRRRRAPVA